MSVNIVEYNTSHLLVELAATAEQIAALRTVLLHETPGVRFMTVSIPTNTTVMSPELILAELGKIRLFIDDPNILPFPKFPSSDTDTLVYQIDYTATEDGFITTSDIIARKHVDGIRLPRGHRIIPVKRGQTLQAVLFAQKGIGPAFTPVHVVNSRIKMKIISNVSKEARDSCIYGVYDIEDFPINRVPESDEYDIYKCVRCGKCTELGVRMKSDVYIVEILATGIDTRVALSIGLSLLRAKGIDLGRVVT
jgi:hypothetical protein